MKTRLAAILLTALTVATVLPAPAATAQADPWAEWWDPAWHMRIPVVVKPRVADTLAPEGDGFIDLAGKTDDHPVFLEVDFVQALIEAGWSQDLGRIASFTFDPDSVRVVRYSGHAADDRPLEEVPSKFYPTRFTAPRAERFDAGSNAFGTVVFVADGEVEGPRHYYLYFDILENGKKPAPDYGDATPSLSDMHWTSRGNVFYGTTGHTVDGQKTNIHVIALHPDTQVRVDRYAAPFDAREGDICERMGRPMQRYELLTCSTGYVNARFRVVADRPVIAAVHGPGSRGPSALTVFPSADGGVVGDRVVAFPMPGQPRSTPVYAVCMDPDGCGDTLTITTASQARVFRDGRFQDVVTTDTRTQRLSNPMGQLSFARVNVDPGAVQIVQAKGDIMVMSGGRGLQMAPSLNGDAAGNVNAFVGGADVYLAAAAEGEAELWDLNTGDQLVADDDKPYPTKDNHWAASLLEQTAGEHHVFSTQTTTPVTVITGTKDDRALVPIGLNADLAQEFFLPRGTHLILFPQYDSTQVTVDRYVGGEPVRVCCNSVLGRDAYKVLDADGGYRVRATKPVTLLGVHPEGLNAYGAFLPGRVQGLDTELLGAEFWGYSGAVATSAGQDPTVDVKPGEETVFQLEVANRGRARDGTALTDRFDLDVRVTDPALRENWTAEISTRTTGELSTGDAQPFTVLVRPPEDATKGTVASVEVTAKSHGNPNLTARLTLRVVVSVFHDFTLTFPDGSKDATRVANGTQPQTFPIRVKNTGTGDDTVRFEIIARPSTRGWTVAVTGADGEAVSEVALAPNETRVVNLTVTPPEEPDNPWLAVNVVGTSLNQVNLKREVRATVVMETNLGVQILADSLEKPVPPGGSTPFNLTVVNTGDAATVALELEGHVPPGFTAQLETADGEPRPGGHRVDLSANGTSADHRAFVVNVTAAEGLLGGESMELLVRADIQSGFQGLDTQEFVIIKAVVDTVHNVVTSGDTHTLIPGEPATIEIPLTNRGNGEAQFRVLPGSLPAGWGLTATPERFRMGLDATNALTLTLTPAAHAPPGPTAVDLALQFDDGAVQRLPLNVTVESLEAYEAIVTGRDLALTPGEEATYSVEVVNSGNLAETLNLTVDAPDDVTASVAPERVEVPPGASRTVLLTLQPARDAPLGNRTVRITGTTPAGDARTVMAAELAVVRADLALERVQRAGELDDGAAVTFTATVRNNGDATARNVLVTLLHDDVPVDNRTIERIPTGESRVAVLKWTVAGSPRGLTVAVDPLDAVVEEDESNNARAAVSGVDAFTPAPGALIALLAAALAARLTPRRRRDPK